MIRVLLFALLFAMPAMADNFSNNQSGVSSCTIDIVGSSSTPITATANYSPITYNCSAGTYLPADAIECATCLAGYYCPGGDYAFNELNASGLNACPGARPSSKPGNSSQNNCYTPCASDKIDAGLDGTNCQTPKFTVTTTNVSAGTEFKFYMSASGTFYVDCGAGGTLSGTGVTNNTITRNDTTEALYTCTYSTAGAKNIRMAGTATGYNTTITSYYRSVAAVRFGYTGASPWLVASISGSIGQIFPTLGTTDDKQPIFLYTFYGTRITDIPATLFNGVSGVTNAMFYGTFASCIELLSIPENLFINVTGVEYKLFNETFSNCQKITSIPENLFVNVIGAGKGDVFMGTFRYCISLQSIPSGLFRGVSYSHYGFYQTFGGCTSLTQLPNGLFNHVRATTSEFAYTFNGCTNLSGYIPPDFFGNLIANGSPYETYMMYQIFDNTGLATTCPAGMTQYITGYEDYWNGKVSCVNANLTCSAGNYLPAHGYECAQCTANNYCVGGTYPYSATESHGITPCDTGYSSAAGASSCTPNTINIQWDDGNGGYTAGTCSYGGSITTPTTAPTKRGHVFTGWTFDLGN